MCHNVNLITGTYVCRDQGRPECGEGCSQSNELVLPAINVTLLIFSHDKDLQLTNTEHRRQSSGTLSLLLDRFVHRCIIVMSRFYARYVPPTKKADAHVDNEAGLSPGVTKRKREQDTPEQNNKKLKRTEAAPNASGAPKDGSPIRSHHEKYSSSTSGKVVLDRYRLTEAGNSGEAMINVKTKPSKILTLSEEDPTKNQSEVKRSKKEKKQKKFRKLGEAATAEVGGAAEATVSTQQLEASQRHDGETLRNGEISPNEKSQKEQKRKPDGTDEEPVEEATNEVNVQKHVGVLRKFQMARQQSHRDLKSEATPKEPPPELHGLEPMPQPVQSETVPEQLTYSILPQWQAQPLLVPLESSTSFSSFNLSETMISNLRKQGLDHPLPVQATVLSLLLNGPTRHTGDLCVSAATGSGKTLSYALPIIADLQDLPGTKLRAVIVVPTRELVKQARVLFEACSAGTPLRLATAVGSKSLIEEQLMLIEEEQVYDPEEYEKWQQSPIDWSTFSLAKLAQNTKDKHPADSVGYITHFRSKVDVLITTPGRLVDHLRSTPGFTLDHVRWLVVDEADRLLNESYQEWVAVVKPALESQAATQRRDELLRYMRLAPPIRNVKKVLLSATMTRDLSKLNAIGLRNPKLVVLGGNKQDNTNTPTFDGDAALPKETDNKETFHLPDTLSETAIPIPDGSEKPLFLLKLLRDHIRVTSISSEPVPIATTDGGSALDSTSDSSSDSDETSSDEYESSSASDSSSASEEGQASNKRVLSKSPGVQQPQSGPRALVFARSTASAERLFRLLCLLDPHMAPRIATLTRSATSSAWSRRALASFRSSRISILIATDRASRGLDVPGLEHVVSYDVPNSALTYVHRVGRTARAGRGGQAWTIVEHREAAWFWREIGGKRKQPVSGPGPNEVHIQRKAKVSKHYLNLEQTDLKRSYEEALKRLGDEVLGKPS